jgi:hypothetical protein
LAHYNYTIKYQPGEQNGAADALSRKGELSPMEPEEEPTVMIPRERFVEIATEVAGIKLDEKGEAVLAALRVVVESDQAIQDRIREKARDTPPDGDIQMENGLPYQDGRIVVPQDEQIHAQILQLYHDSLMAGHLGQHSTLELV